ncbi:dTDP-glucose 4,6-dehydratase [Candidatus Peregrinibacteria bacterium]|nr:dTDP-glucose 4,6-dehydratase [Candidatus Peregrinibacteria bacterium]
MRLLITGGAGFIGSNFIHYLVKEHPDYPIINLDKLTYAGNPDNLKEVVGHPNYRFVQGDIADRKLVDSLAGEADVIVNFAAETHVDRSITGPEVFLQTNILGTQALLEAALKHKHPRYVQVSTDEVYGDIVKGHFTENDRLKPSSPYAASKAAADLLISAYQRTYGLPAVISRCANNYGPRQFPEKIIPFFVKRLMEGKTVPVYGKGQNIRDWLHVSDHCRAIDLVLHTGRLGEVYNVGAGNEHINLDVAKAIIRLLGLSEDRIEFVTDRLGHDVRYAVDSSKIRKELGWKPEIDFDRGLKETVQWYKEHLTHDT